MAGNRSCAGSPEGRSPWGRSALWSRAGFKAPPAEPACVVAEWQSNGVASRRLLDCTYWSGVPAGGVEMYPRDGRFLVARPTNDGLTLMTVLWPRDACCQVRADTEGNHHKALELAPTIVERVRG